MSAEAARSFGISQDDLAKFLALNIPKEEITPSIKISDTAKHTILIISILLFILAILTCGCTFCLWLVSKKKRDKYKKLDDTDAAELACDQDAVKESVNGNESLPQMTEKPKLQSNITFPEKEPFEEEELKKLKVEKLDLSSSYYTNRDRLQVNVRRIVISEFDSKLSNNAYIYVIVSLLQEKDAFFESELRPIAEENYFDEAAEFQIVEDEIINRTLKVSIYACDRFSQHRLVNEYTYELETDHEGDNVSILPVNMKLLTTAGDSSKTPEKEEEHGEVLFSLCYMPTSGRLTFVALKGRNISDEKETPLETYLRVSLLVSGKTMKTVQTSTIRRSSTPVYNEAFVFHSPLEHIKDTDIIVSVMLRGSQSKASPKMLGKVIVGPESDNNLGRKHWEAMLTSPRKPIAQWHALSEPTTS